MGGNRLNYMAYPWCIEGTEELIVYLKNTRHIISSNEMTLFKCDFMDKTENLSDLEWKKMEIVLLKNCKVCDKQKLSEIFYGIEELENTPIDVGLDTSKYNDIVDSFEEFYNLISIFDELAISAEQIFLRYGIKNIEYVKWITDLEKNSEFIEIDGKKLIILSYSQISDFVKIILANMEMKDVAIMHNRGIVSATQLEKVSADKNIIQWIQTIELDTDKIQNTILDNDYDYKIILREIYKVMADLCFTYGYYDAAFHYITQSNEIKKHTSDFSNDLLGRLLIKRSALFLMSHEIHHVEFQNIDNNQYNIFLEWLFVGMNLFGDEDESWKSYAFEICNRSHLIIDELLEGLGYDFEAKSLLDACKPEILAWTKFYNINDDIYVNELSENESKQIIEESYCDYMAIYDILEDERPHDVNELIGIFCTIIEIMLIQETNNTAKQMLEFIEGKIDSISQKHITRLQFVIRAILNDFSILISENNGIKIDDETLNSMPRFDVFKYFINEDDLEFKLYNGINTIFSKLNEIHEFYYKSVIYTFFHIYQDGYITKSFDGIYLKSMERNSKAYTAIVNANIICNSMTHIDLIKNISDNIRGEKLKYPGCSFLNMNQLLKILNSDKILKLYTDIHI